MPSIPASSKCSAFVGGIAVNEGTIIPNGEICPPCAAAGHSSGESLTREPREDCPQLRRGAETGRPEFGRDFRAVTLALANRSLEQSDVADNPRSQVGKLRGRTGRRLCSRNSAIATGRRATAGADAGRERTAAWGIDRALLGLGYCTEVHENGQAYVANSGELIMYTQVPRGAMGTGQDGVHSANDTTSYGKTLHAPAEWFKTWAKLWLARAV